LTASPVPAAEPLAIVLGGTHPHRALIGNLKARGYRVLLVDYLESPPAKAAADEHVRISTLAMDDVLALARAREAALVIAACVDRANVTAAYVAERLGLPAPYDFATAELIANKRAMKQRLLSLGVPTAAFEVLGSAAEAERLSMRFPVVAKPIDTGGSKGVRKAGDPVQLQLAVQEAFRVTRSAEILVEEFLDGVEVSADCLVQDGEPHVLMLRRKYVQRGEAGEVLSAYASVCPGGMRPAAEARIQRLTRDIARGFGLRTTPLLVQFMVDGDDVRVIEFAPRVGGGLNYRVVLLHAGIDIVDASVDAFLGRSVTLAAARSGGYIATHHVYTEAGRFGQVRKHERLVEEGIVAEFYVNKTRGAPIGAGMTSADRVASFIVLAQSAEELLRRVREAMQRIDVVDVDGRSIIRRHVYLKAL
jgi:biotin carboxylase